jgi:hypothetical protein
MCVSIILQLRYYHSRTGAPIHPEHLEWDSDDDVDHEWLVQQVPSGSSRCCAATHSFRLCHTVEHGCAWAWRCSAWARVFTIEGFCGHTAVAYGGRGTGRVYVSPLRLAAAVHCWCRSIRRLVQSLLTAACNITQNNKLLDEFEDVSETEKEFMKLWNPFIFKQRIFADWSAPCAMPCRAHPAL